MSLSAPDTIGGIISDNCIYGGEYITYTGLVAGNTYRVSTVGNTAFDTQITIFRNGLPVAYNDDAPTGTVQSEIYFCPTVTGDYDIQVNEYNCLSNTTCMSLEVELSFLPVSVVTIPVVFHVVHYGEAYGVGRNISDAQIQDQINILNQDYRRMNSDFNNTPAIFAGVSSDVQIEFCLAQRDQNGNSTSGIIRWLAPNPTYSKSDFTAFIKPTTSWDRDSYLNFWIADITSDPPPITSTDVLYGFATFPDPAFPANTDGVVCNYKAIGVSPNNIPTANKGRTATHEVGHWLNLYHTFQDGCNGVGDNCFDTPYQGISTWDNPTNSMCPGSFQSAAFTCSSYDMYPNYMDYTNDDCLSMFTFGQKSRTRNTLLNFRASILSSQGCVPVPIVYGCTNPLATNYDPLATIDDGTCIIPSMCCNSSAYGTATASNISSVTISTCSYLNEYSTISGVLASTSYTAEVSGQFASPGWITVYEGSSCGNFIGEGSSPYTFTSTVAGTYYIHWSVDASCATNSVCHTTSIAGNTLNGCTDPLAINYDPTATVDDGTCAYLMPCNEVAPTGLFASDVIHTRATINWDNMNSGSCFVDQYRIQYRVLGSSSWSQKTMSGPVGSCTFASQKTDKLLLGLTANSTYEYQMKAWYCGGGNSSWSTVATFTTLADCPNVGNLAVVGATPTKATFTWDASNGTYAFVRLKARVDSISNPTGADFFQIGGAGVSYGTNTKNKNGLMPGETYRGQARTYCDPNGGAWKSPTWTPLVYWAQPTQRIEGGDAIANLAIYPNPSKDVFNVTFTSERVQDLRVRVMNIIGEEIIIEELEQFIGEYTKQINLEDNAKGIYFLEIETNDGVINKKLILQ
jgi:hypothetical protein